MGGKRFGVTKHVSTGQSMSSRLLTCSATSQLAHAVCKASEHSRGSHSKPEADICLLCVLVLGEAVFGLAFPTTLAYTRGKQVFLYLFAGSQGLQLMPLTQLLRQLLKTEGLSCSTPLACCSVAWPLRCPDLAIPAYER